MGIVKQDKINDFKYYQSREKYFLNQAIQQIYRAYIIGMNDNLNEISIELALHIGCDFLKRAYEIRKRMEECYVNKQTRTKSKVR